MATNYVITARTTTSTTGDNRLTGLSPSWAMLKRLSDGADVSPRPTVVEVGQGQYRFSYDAANGEASGQIDLGATVLNPNDRYIDVILAADSELLASNLDAPVSGVAAAVNTITLDSGVVSASPAPNTTTFSVSGLGTQPYRGGLLLAVGSQAVLCTISRDDVTGSDHVFTLSTALSAAPAIGAAVSVW